LALIEAGIDDAGKARRLARLPEIEASEDLKFAQDAAVSMM
jgi:hypothetical protein